MHTILLFTLLAACSGGAPSSPADCAGIGSARARDECYLQVIEGVFKADAAVGVKLVEEDISDPLTRDMAWYTITKNVDPNSNQYCERIKDGTLAERCRTVVARPHLHRDLTHSEQGETLNRPLGPGNNPGPTP